MKSLCNMEGNCVIVELMFKKNKTKKKVISIFLLCVLYRSCFVFGKG